MKKPSFLLMLAFFCTFSTFGDQSTSIYNCQKMLSFKSNNFRISSFYQKFDFNNNYNVDFKFSYDNNLLVDISIQYENFSTIMYHFEYDHEGRLEKAISSNPDESEAIIENSFQYIPSEKILFNGAEYPLDFYEIDNLYIYREDSTPNYALISHNIRYSFIDKLFYISRSACVDAYNLSSIKMEDDKKWTFSASLHEKGEQKSNNLFLAQQGDEIIIVMNINKYGNIESVKYLSNQNEQLLLSSEYVYRNELIDIVSKKINGEERYYTSYDWENGGSNIVIFEL